jgi:hypothetical protein
MHRDPIKKDLKLLTPHTRRGKLHPNLIIPSLKSAAQGDRRASRHSKESHDMHPRLLSSSLSLRPWHLWAGMSILLAACGGGSDTSTGSAMESSSTDAHAMKTMAASDSVRTALNSGNPSGTTLTEVSSAVQSLLATQATDYAAVKQALFGLNANGSANSSSLTALTWDPSHDSSSFQILDRIQNLPIVQSNWSYTSNAAGTSTTLAVVGTAPGGTARYAAFGGNPLGVRGNAAMDQLMVNTIAWLTQRTSFTNLKVVTAHLPGTETYWFPHETKTRSWLASTFPGVTINGISTSPATQTDNRCDGANLATCLNGADLLIIGREQGPNAYDGATVMQAVKDAQARSIPVLYLHHYRDTNDLAARMLDYFGLAQVNNYWAQNGLSSYAPATLPTVPNGLDAVHSLVTRLEQGTFSSTWTGCTTSGRIACTGDATYMAQFDTPAKSIQTSLRTLDANNTALFSRSGYALEKLLVLLGDKYRETVSYPMSKLKSGQAFYRAYFSDLSAYIHRPYAAVAKNLGNFSNLIPATTPALSRSVTVSLPASGTRDHMTGLYLMPGRPVTITRTDTGSSAVKFSVNMLRDTTWVFNEPSGLDRPTSLASPKSALAAGQSVTITSPYGGPLFLHVDAASGTSPSVSVQVDGVTTHPVLRDATNADAVAAFKSELLSTPTNWVGVTSDTLTLHSTLANFNQSISSYGGDLSKLAAATWTYTIKDTYELAGFNSASGQYVLPSAAQAVCTSRGWDCTGTQHRRDVVQHVISDNHATCGNGCSGNPYDQDWAFDPMGWGETHEIGHNLQRTRLKIYGGQSGEVSNNIFPVHKRTMYNQTAAGLASPLVDRSGTGLAVFNTLKTALTTTNPSQSAYTAIWSDTAYAANNSARVMFYRQLVEYARHYNGAALSDGWSLVTLMHLLDRNLDANQSNWAAVASNFGFGTYGSYPSAMDGNDFMLITASSLIGRDMRPMFDLWGVTYSSAASSQVAAYGLTAADKLLFPMSQVSQIPTRVGTPIVMSPTATYPTGY